ncbi:spermidine synthase [Lysobacter terrae]
MSARALHATDRAESGALGAVAPTARLAIAIALVSAAALAYQLLLMRWLAIVHWYPFAAMIISLALLGHGASGTWLSLWLRRDADVRLGRHFERAFAACALLFAATAVAALAIAARIPFNGLELVWNPRQSLWLSALYLVLSMPFFFAASCFGLAFARHGERIPQLYGADLAGAGIGAIAATALAYLPVERGLLLAALCGPVAAVLVSMQARVWLGAMLVAIATLAFIPGHALAPRPNAYKGVSKALLMPGAHLVAQHSGPYGWLAVLDSPRVPLRYAPGLSLSAAVEPPPQLGLYTDGDALSVIVHDRSVRDSEDLRAQASWLGAMTSALPYRMQVPRTVLVLSAGGGMEVMQALALGTSHVDAVELDPQRVRWLREDYARYSGGLYRDARVRAVVAEPRAFVRASRNRYDLIVLAGGDSFASSGAGAQAASEQYALTVEAVHDYLQRLTPRGMLAITRWSKQPPRDELKLLATAVAALRESGAADPAAQLAAIRNWDASTWLVARGPFTDAELQALQAFAAAQGFDPVHVPGVHADPAQRFHVLEPPYLFDGVQALLSPQSRDYVRDYKFAIAPARDDRPYFGHFFRWQSLPELWRLREQGSAVLLDSGYLLLIAALMQAVPLALLLVLVPLWFIPRQDMGMQRVSRLRAGAYFLALGLAFLLIEIATLSRLTLLLGHPLVAASVGLAGFLLCAGAGSLHTQRWLARDPTTDEARIAGRVRWAVRAIVLGLLWQFLVFFLAWTAGATWPVWTRALLGLTGIAPLAFAMGMPFALGLSRLARTAPAFVPWAWGLNGCASVIAAMLAVLLAMAFGLRATLVIAAALYLFAAWVWPARLR